VTVVLGRLSIAITVASISDRCAQRRNWGSIGGMETAISYDERSKLAGEYSMNFIWRIFHEFYLSIYLFAHYPSTCLPTYLSVYLYMALQPLWTLADFSVS
jgi:hypothetical protein